jgi:hypothetical protein
VTTKIKPLKWTPDETVGFSVTRREDGGMHFTFRDVSNATIAKWREFALDHLLDSDRLTRNLYDLRQVETITQEAVQAAVEANSDPSARNIRLAFVLGNQESIDAIRLIAGLTQQPGGAEFGMFTSVEEAETWLSRPLDLL